MRKDSFTIISNLCKLPSYFERANPAYSRYIKYKSSDPLLSYFAGLYTFETLLRLVGTFNSITGEPLVNDKKNIAAHLITVLEYEKEKLRINDRYKSIIESRKNSREYIISCFEDSFNEASSSIELAKVSDKTVQDLKDCAFWFTVAKTLFPFNSSEDVATIQCIKKTDSNDEDLNNELHDLTSSEKQDAEIEAKITENIEKLAGHFTLEEKENQVVNSLIEDWNQITDDDLDAKVSYCRENYKRIFDSVRNGDDPQASSGKFDNISNNEIEQMLRSVLELPSDNEDQPGESIFPVLPQGRPGESSKEETPHIDKSEEETHAEIRDVEHPDGRFDIESDKDSAEYVSKYHDSTTVLRPIPEKITKEVVRRYLEDDELLERAQKCTKYAISSISFEDVDTALAELNKAIELLQQYKTRQG